MARSTMRTNRQDGVKITESPRSTRSATHPSGATCSGASRTRHGSLRSTDPGSVLGDLSSMGKAPYSEYELLWSGNIPRLARYLADILIPSVPGRAPAWLRPPVSTLFFHRSHELKDAGRAPARRFGGDQWFFVNGIRDVLDRDRPHQTRAQRRQQMPVEVVAVVLEPQTPLPLSVDTPALVESGRRERMFGAV